MAVKKDYAKAIEGASAYVLAAWKGGELLKELEKDGSGGDRKSAGHDGRVISPYARTLTAAKLSESTAKRWQRIAPDLYSHRCPLYSGPAAIRAPARPLIPES